MMANDDDDDAAKKEQAFLLDLGSMREHFVAMQKRIDEQEAQHLLEVDLLKKKVDSLSAWKESTTTTTTSTATSMSGSFNGTQNQHVNPPLSGSRKEQSQEQFHGQHLVMNEVSSEESESCEFFDEDEEFDPDCSIDVDMDASVLDVDEVVEQMRRAKQTKRQVARQESQFSMPQLGNGSSNKSLETRNSMLLSERYVLPEDVFTMLFFADHYTAAFAYGLFVFGFQMLTLSILFSDLTSDEGLPIGEVDRNRLNVPIQVDWQVHIARIIAVLVSVVSRDDCLDTFWIVTIGFKRRWQDHFPGATVPQFVLMNVMRFTEGAFTIIISFIVAVQSDNVIDLFLNFAAIEFVSNLDNLAYTLAASGWLTGSMVELAERIASVNIYMTKKDKRKLKRKQFIKHILMVVMLVALYSGLFAIYRIEQNGILLRDVSCDRVLITFGEEMFRFSSVPANTFKGFQTTTIEIDEAEQDFRTILGSKRPILSSFDADNPSDLLFSHFSGVYEGLFEKNERIADRPVYYERGFVDPTSGKFYYCENEQAWVFSIEAFGSQGAVPKPTIDRCGSDGWLMRSPVTEAYALEDVPADGWKVWTGSLVETKDLEIKCGVCRSDIDCSVVRGVCNSGRCTCNEGSEGIFCEADTPCDHVVSYAEGKTKIFSKSYFSSNKRPIYLLDLDDDRDRLLEETRDDLSETENSTWASDGQSSWRMVLHTGTRWYEMVFSKDDLNVFYAFSIRDDLRDRQLLFRFSNWFHPYWAGIRIDGTQHISERTEQTTPTGPLAWQTFLESRAEGSYGIYGGLKDYIRSFECLSVDCSIERMCGDFGTCEDVDDIVVFGGTVETGIPGNQCVCNEPLATGHFCEFQNLIEWDENGTITRGPYELDPYQAVCYGPLRDFPDCFAKLYPDSEGDN